MFGLGVGGNSRLALGVVIAIATGIAFYFLSDVKSVLAFVAGLQVTLLSLQVESLIKERRQDDRITRQNRIIGDIEQLEWMPVLVERIAQSAMATKQRYPATMAASAARLRIEECANELSQLELGHLSSDYEDIGPLLHHASHARGSIRSTSLQSVDLQWWLSPLGRKYWQALQAAIARGVHCERIFIYGEWNSDLETLAQEQAAAGVHVLRVNREELAPRLRVDIIMWDEAVGYETRLNDRGEGQRNFFTFQREEVSRMILLYNAIYGCATDLTGESRPCILH